MSEQIKRFASLFRGNDRSYGQFEQGSSPKGTLWTEKGKKYTIDDVEAHINGVRGLGAVPIMDDGFCWFGVIDIDDHNGPGVDLVAIEKEVRAQGLPLTVCRSRSGGAHLYLFVNEPVRARVIRTALAKWASDIGYRGVEVFPKQDVLLADDEAPGGLQLGNWINLPWFDADSEECLRYTVEGGKRIDFNHFLDTAEARRISGAMLLEKSENQHSEAPPCIQRMIADGVGKGQRNEAMYNIVVYLKRAYPESYKDKAHDLNVKIFDEPMSHSEAQKVIGSAGRRDYRYKCKEEPCKSLCRSFECVNRKFGITPDEKGELEMGVAPAFGPLEKYMTNPVRWVLHVNNARINLTTPQLMDFRQIREAIADTLTMLVPPMKNDRWQVLLYSMMQEATLLEAPEEATVEGVIKSRLLQFLEKANLDNDGTNIVDREALLYGSPVVQVDDKGDRLIYFRGSDFLDYLKKQRMDDVKGPNLWIMLREQGLGNAKLRVGSKSINVWSWPLTEAKGTITPKEVRSEF